MQLTPAVKLTTKFKPTGIAEQQIPNPSSGMAEAADRACWLHSQLALMEWRPTGAALRGGRRSAADALSKRSARTRSWRRRSGRGGGDGEAAG